MKWLKRIGLALFALLLLVAVGLWWLLGTGSGLRFVLARAQGATNGAISVQHADGRLIGPLDLTNLRYDDGQGTVVKLAKAHLDLRFWPLLRERVHVLDLDADGIDVALPKSAPESETSSSSFSLKPPIALIFDRVHIGAVNITEDGQPLFASTRLDLSGRWTNAGIAVTQLVLDAPDGHVDLTGQFGIGRNYRGNGHADFAWKLDDTRYVGNLRAHSDGLHAQTTLKLEQPLVAQLQLDLTQRDDYAWTAKLDAPHFDPKPLIGDSELKAVALALQGHGDQYSGTLEGQLGLNEYQLRLQPLSAKFSNDYHTLTLQQLALASPQIPGTVNASGTLQLDAQPLRANLDIQWKDLQLPPALVGQELSSQGQLKANGSVDQFHAEGDVDIGPPGKLAKLSLNLDGTQKLITLHTLQLKQPQGGLDASGVLTLQPELAWQLNANANKLDPGQLFAGWNGALDFALNTEGKLAKQGPDATLELQKLTGILRDRNVNGNGTLHVTADQILDGKFALQSGGSSVQIDAKSAGANTGKRNDIDVKLAITSLGDWLPDAGGSLNGEFRVRGAWPKLSVNGQLQGQTMAWQDQKIERLRLDADVPDISNPGGKLDLETDGVQAGGLAFQHIVLRGDGTAAKHNLSFDARGTPLSTELALSGSLKGEAWSGNLSSLNLDLQGLPRWHLQQPARLSWNDGAIGLSELCLSAGDPLLCVAGSQDKAGKLDATYRLHSLPLALLLSVAAPGGMPLRADGSLDGNGHIRRSAAGALDGNATITSTRGSITYAEHADRPLLSYDNLALNAALSPASQRINVQANLNNNGRLDGQIGITGVQQALDGQINLHLGSLNLIELFTDSVANVHGDLNGSFRLGGTLQQPAVIGQATVSDFATEVPDAGLKLSQGQLVVSTTDAQQFRIDGSVKSGDGTLNINGTANLGANAATTITLKGSQFTAADIPAAKVVISPNLVVKQDDKSIDLSGSLAIDRADVNLEKLPGGGANSASSDVIVVDQEQQQAAESPLQITANVQVDLGHKTHIIGMGLDGRLGGILTVIQRPDRSAIGQGQVSVSGTYKAYGQNLNIEQGQLLFASTPLDNPGLNIRAARKLNPNATIDEGQQVGLLISGTAQRPVLTVFSNPVMEQSDALSYLVTGKPLSQVKGGEGNAVGAAAQALGSAAGDLLAKSIGSKIGVDDIGVSSNEALGGNSAFTVGKYLSPRLYLSYGVGLFEPGQVITLRYRLSHHWSFEAQNATDFSRASLNYRYEK
ncbi:MAG: translocation/assembly module TamB domain-containing protein [Rhodanobacter sp.]